MAHPPSPRDLLYTHGTISRTLGVQDASLYFNRLLRIDERGLQPLFHHEWPEAFFITNPTVSGAHPSVYTTCNRPAWLLDYVVRKYGTVVPQRIWSPGTAGDTQAHNNVALNMPIFFVHNDRMTVGLQLVSAAAGHCVGLMNGRVTAPVGTCHTLSIRIKWPGYSEWTTQIMTRDQTLARRTIPLEKLAKRVARAVCQFLEFVARQQCQYPDWQVDGGGITSNDIILIGFIHVTQGSWQPILQLNRVSDGKLTIPDYVSNLTV